MSQARALNTVLRVHTEQLLREVVLATPERRNSLKKLSTVEPPWKAREGTRPRKVAIAVGEEFQVQGLCIQGAPIRESAKPHEVAEEEHKQPIATPACA